jgi:hypothetical protein
MDADASQATIRIERTGVFGIVAKFRVVIDELIVGESARNSQSEFRVSPGTHWIYVRAPQPSKERSNALEVELAPGQSIDLVCHATFPIHKSLARSLTLGAYKPRLLFLAER